MRVFMKTDEGFLVEDHASAISAVIGRLPTQPLLEAPLVLGVERTVQGKSPVAVGLGPFETEAIAHDVFVDAFVDRFKRFPDGAIEGASPEKRRLLGRVPIVLLPQQLDRDRGFILFGAAWRAAETGGNVFETVQALWKRLKPQSSGGEDQTTGLSAPKEVKRRQGIVTARLAAEDRKAGRRVFAVVPGRG